MSFSDEKMGATVAPSPKSWGPIQKDGGYWCLGPRLFSSLVMQCLKNRRKSVIVLLLTRLMVGFGNPPKIWTRFVYMYSACGVPARKPPNLFQSRFIFILLANLWHHSSGIPTSSPYVLLASSLWVKKRRYDNRKSHNILTRTAFRRLVENRVFYICFSKLCSRSLVEYTMYIYILHKRTCKHVTAGSKKI